MKLDLLEGLAAELLLRDQAFVEEWTALCVRCPWTTVFQGPSFATVWYDVYSPSYAPLLIIRRDSSGSLSGLLALARARASGALCAAGSYHAEYQCWVADADDDGRFGLQALATLRERYPRKSLTLRYIPPHAPLQRVAASVRTRPGLAITAESRPVMMLDGGVAAREWLERKKHRDRLRRLSAGEALRFEEVDNADALERIIDRFLDLYDFRQGAVNGAPPSRLDPHHRAFYLALMRVPGLLHVTVQQRGETLVSAHINVRNGAEVTLGLLAQSPADAEHSPGVFHIQQLARMAGEQGYRALDLTPGADAYKDRFATSRDTVHVLALTAPGEALVRSARGAARRGGRRVLQRLGVDADHARGFAHGAAGMAAMVWSSGTKALLHDLTSGRRPQTTAYAVQGRCTQGQIEALELDSLPALLAYRPGALGWHPRQRFLGLALDRLAEGQHLVSRVNGGKLVFTAWIGTKRAKSGPRLGSVPEGVALVYDVRVDRTVPRDRVVAMVSSAVRQAASSTGLPQVLVLTREPRGLVAEALETIGAMPIPETGAPPVSHRAPELPAVQVPNSPPLRAAEPARQA